MDPIPTLSVSIFWQPCPFRHFKVINLVWTVDMGHAIDNSLTTEQYFAILYMLLISELTKDLQMEAAAIIK